MSSLPHPTIQRQVKTWGGEYKPDKYGLTKVLGMDGVEQRVAHWSEEFGLTDLLRREPFSLSGGEKQKV